MEFLIFSDIHFDLNHNKSYVKDGLTSWVFHQLNVIDQISSYGLKNTVKDIFFGGDLFEKKNYLPQNLYNIVWETFKYNVGCDFDFHLNTGNHDYHSKVSSSLKPFSNIVNIVTEPTDIELSEGIVRVIPYGMVDKNLKLPEAGEELVLITHEDIAGLKYGASDYTSSSRYKRQIFGDWDMVFNGHIHKAQRLGNIYNIGSCMRQDFGETDKKYFYHYKNGEVKAIEIKCPEFIIVPGFSEKIRQGAERDDYNFYRIDVNSEELADPIFNKFNVFPNIVKTKDKKVRLKQGLTEEEEFLKYMEIVETDLNKEKLLKLVEEIR